MKTAIEMRDYVVAKAEDNSAFRARLLENPKAAIKQEFGVVLPQGHAVEVHEETDNVAHLVLPAKSRFSDADRKAAMTGDTSLEYLRKVLHRPAPPARPPVEKPASAAIRNRTATLEALAEAGRAAIRRGLEFLETAVDKDGSWHAIRYMLYKPDGPRHFETTPFTSALGALALERCGAARARAICARTREYLFSSVEYPGVWRYWRHLPHDLDSTSICSLAAGPHPWFLLGRNVDRILSNRDEEGRFMTWMLAENEPGIAASMRRNVDLVVNANTIAFLGDHRQTRDAQRWVETSIEQDRPARLFDGSPTLSTLYPHSMAAYYATARASICARPAFAQLRPVLADRIMGYRGAGGDFGDILVTAQAVSALDMIGSLESGQTQHQIVRFVDTQREDGSWPEQLAWDVPLMGFASEALTTAFCIEALERCIRPGRPDQ